MSTSYFTRFRAKLKDALAARGQEPTGQRLDFCPAHDDHNPSLALKTVAGAPVFRCLAGCSEAAVLEALGITEDDVAAENRITEAIQDAEPAEIYEYWLPDDDTGPSHMKRRFTLRDADGNVVGKTFDVLTAKRFRDLPDDQQPPMPLYRARDALADLTNATAQLTLLVTAGEKDCETAQEEADEQGAPVTAVSGAHGETAASTTLDGLTVLLEIVRDEGLNDRLRNIVICYDLDQAGVEGAIDLAARAAYLPRRTLPVHIQMTLPATREAGHDLTDAYDAGMRPSWEIAPTEEIVQIAADETNNLDAKAVRMRHTTNLRALGEAVAYSDDDGALHPTVVMQQYKLEAVLQAAVRRKLRPVNLRNRGEIAFGPADASAHYTSSSASSTQIVSLMKADYGIEISRADTTAAEAQLRAHIMDDEVVDPPARVYRTPEAIFVDCGDDDQCARIDMCSGGVTAVKSPVQWWRDDAAARLPTPDLSVTPTDAVALVQQIANLNDEQTVHALAWMVRVYEGGQNALLLLKAAADRGKSSTMRTLTTCVEPRQGDAAAQLIRMPAEPWEWASTASTRAAMAIDNLGSLPKNMADIPTMAVTGATTEKRALYENHRMLSLPLGTSLLVSSLSMTGWKPDLVTRTIVIEPGPLPAEGRMDDEELARAQEEVAPKLMGALLQLVGMVCVDKRMRDWQDHQTHRVVGWGRTVAILDEILGTKAHAEMMAASSESLAAQPVAPWVESLVSWAVLYPDATRKRRLVELRQLYAANTARPAHPLDDVMQPDRRALPGSDRAAADMLVQAEGVLSSMGVRVERHHTKRGNLWTVAVDGDSVSEIRLRLGMPVHEVDLDLIDDVLDGPKPARRSYVKREAA